jgi:hypothetical protein
MRRKGGTRGDRALQIGLAIPQPTAEQCSRLAEILGKGKVARAFAWPGLAGGQGAQ